MRPLNSEFESASTSASRNRGSSKAISGRILTAAGLEPHPITKSVWKWTNRCTLLTIVGCVAYVAFGDDRAFQTHHVSKPHRVFEKDCSRCHTKWGPLYRLGATFTGHDVWSVSNEKCEACHVGARHHENQWPPHTPLSEEVDPRGVFLSCAKCHREHRGDVNIAESASQHCVECHADLPRHAYPDLTDPAWAQSVTSFEAVGGHPEFALLRRLEGDNDVPNDGVLEKFVRSQALEALVLPEGAEQPTGDRWQDPGRIRFNHYAHLQRPMPVEANEANVVRWGDRVDEKTQTVSMNCADCHEPDNAGRYMQPIDYTKHCQICHPVRFDTERFPDRVIPHGGIAAAARDARDEPGGDEEVNGNGPGIDLLLGFLAEQYADDVVAQRPEQPDLLGQMPGRPRRSILTATESEQVRGSVDKSRNVLLRDLTDAELGRLRANLNSLDSCRFCHEVDATDNAFRITPTRIPERWMPHSRFDHSRHRELSCRACHQNFTAAEPFRSVEKSFDTGDVLMPGIAICRHCHVPHPSQPNLGSARSDCVECHRYHDHSLDPTDMGHNLLLEPIEE